MLSRCFSVSVYTAMKKTLLKSFLLLIGLLYGSHAKDIKNGDMPVAPLQTTEFQGWTNTMILETEQICVVLNPDTGRIALIGPDRETNLLRMDESLKGKVFPQDDAGNWQNFGGDWLWPVAQSRWKDIQGKDWPPSRLLDGRPWTSRSWKDANGTLCCRLTQTYEAPLHIKVSRLVKVPQDSRHFTIDQQIERMADSEVPVTLWNISQVAAPEMVGLAISPESKIENGYRSMGFDALPESVTTPCQGAMVFHTDVPGEYKICSDAVPAWICARNKEWTLVEAALQTTSGTYPDGGCTLEMYSNSGLGYAEIETLSTEVNLAVGDMLDNTLRISIIKHESSGTNDCEWIELIQASMTP